ncbi:MAG: DEAD/DEAH box helicase family protein [Oscillatoria sp. PMC 1068.18]|nr:DEAD/DEAH box helicase family protein [Oscillatoria sp. PMC 1068.18]
MPIDFDKFTPSKPVKKLIDPIEIFQNLKVKDSAINDLWLAQGDALRDWHSQRNSEDVAIILNTGAGKTLVGLLAAQSIVNETNERVLYACSSINLVEQTESKAKGYGLEIATYIKGEYRNKSLYQRCLAPCVTTYQAIFNGKSRFFREKPIAIIFDDAHAAEHLLRDHFTLKIKRNNFTELFSKIFELFRSYHEKIGKGISYSEINHNKDRNTYFFIPPFSLYENCNELKRILVEAKLNNEIDTMFAWEHLKDKIDLCTVFISGKEITITPPMVPVSHFLYFQKGIRRIYLSATLSAKDKFLRTFGKNPEIIAPKTTAGECERLIIIPCLNQTSNREDDLEVAKDIIKDKKALILVPSYRRAEKWSDIASINSTDEVTKQIGSFRESQSTDKLVLASRYDGIDLPGDTCRVMVIDDLPSSLNIIEKYFWEQLQLVKNMRSAIASRVVQAFGRISRGMSDYGVVIITGDKLTDWLFEKENKAILPSFLKQQIEVGIDISEQAESLKDLIDSASQCLDRDEKWVNYHQRNISTNMDKQDTNIDEDALKIAEVEVKFINAFWKRDYEQAAKVLHDSLVETFELSSHTGAWHHLWLGYCYEQINDIEKAYESYRDAHNTVPNIPPPLPSHYYSESDLSLPTQVLEVSRYLDTRSTQINKQIPKNFDTNLAVLNGTGTSGQTEETLRYLGQYLGFSSSRPDKEYGTGSDVLWISENKEALCLEVKTDKKDDSKYKKEDIGQLRDHIQWVKNKYKFKIIYPAFVGLLIPPSSSANPDAEIQVIQLEEFYKIAERLRAALNDILNKSIPSNLPQNIFEIFEERNLLWGDLYRKIQKTTLVELKSR